MLLVKEIFPLSEIIFQKLVKQKVSGGELVFCPFKVKVSPEEIPQETIFYNW